MRKRRVFGVVAIVASFLAIVSTAGLAKDTSTRETARFSSSNWTASFPLWIDVPGRTFITLGEGRLPDGTRWGVFASRVGKRESGRKNPCLSVARITRAGAYGDAHRCGEPAPAGNQPPVYVSISGSYQNSAAGPVIGEAVMGLSFRSDVKEAKLVFADGGSTVRPAKLVNPTQRRKTRLPEFRYVALGIQRDVCVATVVGYGGQGQVIFEAPTGLC